jgi:uncharacterized membrane protein (DUF441 family)
MVSYLRKDVLSERNVSLGVILRAGVLSGTVAGVIMALVSMLSSSFVGMEFFLPAKLIAATWFGVDALIGGSGIILAGIVTHLVISAAVGAGFAGVTLRNYSVGQAFASGAAYGVFVWAVATFLFLPVMNPTMDTRMALTPGIWFVVHLVYGGVLCLTPVFIRALSAPTELEVRRFDTAA